MPLVRLSPRRRRLLLPVLVLVTGLVFVAGIHEASALTATPAFPAQGGTWSRHDETKGTRYLLQQPLVGSGTQATQPVAYGVRTWQQLLNTTGQAVVPVDGIYGAQTQAAVVTYQRAHGLPANGVVGYQTARSLLAPVVAAQAASVGEPASVLLCHLAAESNLDAGAVGPNGSDLGIAQISLSYNAGISVRRAFNIGPAIRFMAVHDVHAYARYHNWDLAVVDYNSPSAAAHWAATGTPSPKAASYAHRVNGGC